MSSSLPEAVDDPNLCVLHACGDVDHIGLLKVGNPKETMSYGRPWQQENEPID